MSKLKKVYKKAVKQFENASGCKGKKKVFGIVEYKGKLYHVQIQKAEQPGDLT